MTDTIRDLLAAHEGTHPVIGAPGRDWLTYDGLRELSGTVSASRNVALSHLRHWASITKPACCELIGRSQQ